MRFTRPSVQTELDRFYKAISQLPNSFDSISKSAFTQSRKKLKPEAFIELSYQQIAHFKEHAPHQKNWKGSRVVAIDGSLLNLPHSQEIENEFGSVHNQHEKIVGARCSFAYDVCNQLVLDATIAPVRSCEKELACEHLKALSPASDILVFDRGYPSQWLVGLLINQGFRFCFRLSTAWKKATAQVSEGESDIDWTMKHNTHKCCDNMKKHNISKQLKGLRLVAVDLPSGEKEILLTNLTDREQFSTQTIKVLYNMRWGVEESYKTFKKTLHVEYFTGRSVQSIKQDFYARVFMLNMASMIRTQGIDRQIGNQQNRKHQLQANKTQVLAKTKDFLIDIFCGSQIKTIVKQLLKILEKRLEVIRPGRSFPRPKTSSRRRAKIINSKGI